MAKRARGEWAPSISYTNRAFRPYTIAIGELTLAWNDLHVSLSLLFCSLLGGGNVGPPMAIWHNISNDRMQRNMLSALAGEVLNDVTPFISGRNGRRYNDKRYEEIKWLCGEANNIEDFRNNALHSPLWGSNRVDGPYIAPLTSLGHIRANKLPGKDLLLEFRTYRDKITALRNYAAEIDQFLSKRGTWPKRPRWPPAPPTKGKSLPRQTRATRPQPPPQSSRG